MGLWNVVWLMQLLVLVCLKFIEIFIVVDGVVLKCFEVNVGLCCDDSVFEILGN